MWTIYSGAPVDVCELSRRFTSHLDATDRADRSIASRHLWFTLVSSEVCRNIYKVRMPYLLRASFKSGDIARWCQVMLLPDEFFDLVLGVPESKRRDKTVFLVSASLCMQIKETRQAERPPRHDIWRPPLDFDALQTAALPPACYVELYLDELQYVSDAREPPAAQASTLFDLALGNSLVLREAWGEFKKTFGQ